MEIGVIALGKEWKVKQQAVSSLMNNAKSSSAVAWVMMNEENYGLSNIPAWVTSLSPPKNEVPPAERGVQTKNTAERGVQTRFPPLNAVYKRKTTHQNHRISVPYSHGNS
jgi:hypothetical protein